MINHRANEIVIVDALQAYLSKSDRPCTVIRRNQVAKAPDYPYLSFTATTPLSEMRGTYSEAEDGSLYRDATQIWSFTVQSDSDDEAMELGMKLSDFFTASGINLLADKGITVRRVTSLTARDNLLTIQYEYRKGLDVTFGFLYSITPDAQLSRDVIETNTFKEV